MLNLNSCLDEAAETALLPSFNGCIGDIPIPGTSFDASFLSAIFERSE